MALWRSLGYLLPPKKLTPPPPPPQTNKNQTNLGLTSKLRSGHSPPCLVVLTVSEMIPQHLLVPLILFVYAAKAFFFFFSPCV